MSLDNEIQNSRVLNHPRELVWRAWEESEHLTKWFGPNGFTSTFHEFNFFTGGDWKFVFHGPDGKNYDNHNLFVEIKHSEHFRRNASKRATFAVASVGGL